MYKKFNEIAQNKKNELLAKNINKISELETKLYNKSLLKLEKKIVNDLFEKEIITPKLHLKFIDDIEQDIYTKI
jgi:flagellar motor component MotA